MSELPVPRTEAVSTSQLASLGFSLRAAVARGGALARLLGGRDVAAAELGDPGDRALVAELAALDVVASEAGVHRPRFAARVVQDLLLFSERWSLEAFRTAHFVDPLWEAPILASLLIRGRARAGLDVGCGCGALALVMARYCDVAVGLDVNPRALTMSRFNAALNGVANVEFHASDLFAAVRGRRFDRMVFNSPTGFEVRPHTLLEAGEPILERFFGGLDPHLSADGYAQVSLMMIDRRRSRFWDRFATWFATAGFQKLFVEKERMDGGWAFFKLRLLQSIRHRTNRFAAIAGIRGLLTLVRGGGPSTQVRGRYAEWAERLGPTFGDALLRWCLAGYPGDADPTSDLPGAERAIGAAVRDAFARTRTPLSA